MLNRHRRRGLWLAGLTVLALISASLFWVRRAHGDAAPDPQLVGADGRGAGPAGITSVQMLTETVLLEIQPVTANFYGYEQQVNGAQVTADFVLHNPEDQPVALPVGFPKYLSQTPPRVSFEEIWNLHAYQSGVELPAYEAKINGQPWALWQMSFPPGDTQLRVTYTMLIAAPEQAPAAVIRYVLHTGAGWAGPIGRADLIVRFPYLAERNFISEQGTLPGYQVEGYDVRWRFENLEPTQADDLALRVANPTHWATVLAARSEVASSPTTASYVDLARAYAALVESFDPTAPDVCQDCFYSRLLAQVAAAQYLKALELDPTNADLRREFASFVQAYAGTLLPAEPGATLTAVYDSAVRAVTGTAAAIAGATGTAPAPVPSPSQAARITALPATPVATGPAATPIAAVSATPLLADTASAATALPASATPLPAAVRNTSGWRIGLMGAFVIMLGLGFWLALRRPGPRRHN